MKFIFINVYTETTMSRNATQKNLNNSFICGNCGSPVNPVEAGTHFRNHCPVCLYSSHVDITTGDRRSGCRGLMAPIGIWAGKRNEWSIIHRCVKCGIIKTNRIAGDDSEIRLIILAVMPLMSTPFPAEILMKDLICTSKGAEPWI